MIQFTERERFSLETFWAYEKKKRALLKALHRIPFEEQNICICFPYPGLPLLRGHWAGAAIYVLTHPAFIDFCHPTTYEPIRLIDREISCFFTLASYRGGRFASEEVRDVLQPMLEKYFGDDVEMAETSLFPF